MNWLIELFQNAAYNRRLYRSGRTNKSIVVHTTIGWKPGDDGFQPDPGNNRVKWDKGSGTYDTPSGNVEYHKVIPRGRR